MNTIPISRDAVEQALPDLPNTRKLFEDDNNIVVGYTSDQMREYAHAALAQADQPAVPKPCGHAFVKATLVFDHETRVQEAKCIKCGAEPGETEEESRQSWEAVDAPILSHREAIAKKDAEFMCAVHQAAEVERNALEVVTRLHAEAAELRAALRACVEALKSKRSYRHSDGVWYDSWDSELVDAAITRAQEVLK